MRLDLDWRWHAWRDLDIDTLYECLRLRVDIFVVEQKCPYPELDGLDPHCEHLTVREPGGALLGYLRLLPPGLKVDEPALGRLVVAAAARGQGLARAMVSEGIRACHARYPQQDIYISGQQHLEDFYASLGFKVSSQPYLDDGIWHVDMLKVWER
ncbi:GNAT family N-acetyltransferase [Solimonas variicoloris]|uniref:GNAT family N-acetyltransferase n=1 Tax=Solimonas variicoloris TaxID=254408 RepID=UPI00036E113E|nr:GNAT family N-acetyltransferase [Solimonas variicoloris]